MESAYRIGCLMDPFGAAAAMARLQRCWLADLPRLADRLRSLMIQVGGFMARESGCAVESYPTTDLQHWAQWQSDAARRYHALVGNWIRQMIQDTPRGGEKDIRQCAFWIDQWLSAVAPTNFFWSNPGAVRRWQSSRGKSAETGLGEWLEDVWSGCRFARQVDESAFKPGENIAATPGSVVFSNELLELIQYHPTTDTGYATPIVMIQPWVNKYYIFDLSAHNSFVRYLVGHGFPVFITSWKNPDQALRAITFDDYLFKGLCPAIRVANEICASPVAHVSGYCIAGTALAVLLAWFNANHADGSPIPVATWSLFSALTDFREPGILGVFTGEAVIDTVQRLAERDGYLDSRYIAATFRLLNAEALIWRAAINNYLFGQPPPKSDLLFWNSDATRLPQAMCMEYLRYFYHQNRLARPRALVAGGRPIDLGDISQPAWIVGAEQDHISPWQSTFRTCHHLTCPTTYVLASEGHITGIVNPASARSRKRFRMGGVNRATDADRWVAENDARQGSWWPEWIRWLGRHSGSRGMPPPVGSRRFPVLQPAPGSYVFEK